MVGGPPSDSAKPIEKIIVSQTCVRFVVERTGEPEVMKWVQEPAPNEDCAAKVQEVTGGRGVAIVCESIGVATFDRSLDCARRFGLVASYGWPTGDSGSVPLMALRSKGSLFVTRPTVTQYTAEAEDFRAGATALFGLIKEGTLRIKVGNSCPLRDADRVHAGLVAGKTLGSVVLLPNH